MKWTVEIVDPNQILNGYWVIDEAAIKADITNGIWQLSGVPNYHVSSALKRALGSVFNKGLSIL
ncbi:hypothetical protein GCM10028805_37550 [Spirosoma harenae]